MKILIIEDDNYKAKRLIEELEGHEYEIAQSFHSGMRKILLNKYDALFLDMNFPLWDNETRMEPEQGMFVLSEMTRKEKLIPTCIYSSDQKDVSKFDFVKGYIHYDAFTSIKSRVKSFLDDIKREEVKNV